MNTQMAQDNLSAVLYGKDDLRMEQREIPVAKKGELLIRSDRICSLSHNVDSETCEAFFWHGTFNG